MERKKVHLPYGISLLAEFWNCKNFRLNYRKILIKATNHAKATPCDVIVSKINPGISALISLTESHISIHTYPEYKMAFIDIFTCGNEAKPELALDYLKKIFKPSRIICKKIKRGKESLD